MKCSSMVRSFSPCVKRITIQRLYIYSIALKGNAHYFTFLASWLKILERRLNNTRERDDIIHNISPSSQSGQMSYINNDTLK
jgi:hypothetical protein